MRKMLSAIVFVDDVDVVVFSFTEVIAKLDFVKTNTNPTYGLKRTNWEGRVRWGH